jgi:hypothetical protein
MMEHDPERLVKGAEGGPARELLLAARSEEAPHAVRDRVLSTLAAAFARARANAVSMPASKLSGVYERFEGESSQLPRGQQSALTLLERRPPLERLSWDPLDAAPIELRRRSRRSERTPLVRRTPIAVQLGAAVLVGVLVATGAHFVSGLVSDGPRVSANEALRPATRPNAERTAVSSGGAELVERGSSGARVSSGATLSSGATVLSGAGMSPGAESPGAESPGAESPGAESPGAESPGAGVAPRVVAAPARGAVDVAPMGVRSGGSCAAGCPPADSAPPARTTTRAAFDELAAEAPGGLSEDWLGEQLALVSRAERSLAEGNPAEALRSLDEYQARFPQGLLDLQIAVLRKKVERLSSTGISSTGISWELPRSN